MRNMSHQRSHCFRILPSVTNQNEDIRSAKELRTVELTRQHQREWDEAETPVKKRNREEIWNKNRRKSFPIDQDRKQLWPKQIELVPYDLVKNRFFLVFRKLICSPNLYGRLVVELSKVKEPSTTDSSLFVSKYNVCLSYLFFWRSFVSQSFGIKTQVLRLGEKKVFLCFSRNFFRVITSSICFFHNWSQELSPSLNYW